MAAVLMILRTCALTLSMALKNYGFLKVDGDLAHYEVAPVFDVSPQRGASHYLHCGDLGRNYSLSEAMTQARKMKIAKAAADEVRDRIIGVLEHRADYFEQAGLTPRQATIAEASILRGCPELAQDKPATVRERA